MRNSLGGNYTIEVDEGDWAILLDGRAIRHYEGKGAAVEDGIERAKLHKGHLVIKGWTGRIEKERTFSDKATGADER